MYEELSDEELLALVMWREARGEGPDGMRAVGHVCKNRATHPGFPKTLREVILQANAFTSMTVPTDPEYRLFPGPEDPQHNFCLESSRSILAGLDDDPTMGACYYWNPAMEHSSWFENHVATSPEHPLVARIGSQEFFA